MIWKILLAVSVSANIWMSGYIDMPLVEYIACMVSLIYGLSVIMRYGREG